ncbi:MAG: glutathione S-transferase family protein [Gammaproteobacteria bacterium]
MAITFCSGSPYAWRVWLALEHKQLAHELKMLSFSGGDLRTPEFTRLNPRQKVPVIEDGDFVLYESVAILEYLDEQYPQAGHGRLFPKDVRHRAIARRLIQETEYLAAPMRELGGELFFKPESGWDLETIAKGREALALELARFQRELRGEYLVYELSASDFTLYPWLALAVRMERKKPDLAIRSLIGASLSDWMRRIEALPYFEKTIPPTGKPHEYGGPNRLRSRECLRRPRTRS